MTIVTSLAIYFIIWWVVLFAVLPFGVRNSHEAGAQVGDGHDAGAPVAHGLLWKAGMTTVVSAVIYVLVRWALSTGVFGG